ncbi:glycosyltransferase family 2 protein [Nocardia sp.]|uniref:glycosyltransferase family 2 protein n=1 Tax=Nocardia sp. TaxID=1821 RepID=UPI002604F2A4|nr:glycosyltransferase family A protein [Nocardia sp.]
MGDVSVVVPVLNDAARIPYCLDRLARQEAIATIIVVDRGSTDDTRWIVQVYSSIIEKVRLISAPGLEKVAARNLGFDAADSEIIGHLGADTRVAFDWARTITHHLSEYPETAAITKINATHARPAHEVPDSEPQIRHRSRIFDIAAGWPRGANLTIRRSVWLEVREETVAVADPRVDFDLALCLSRRGRRIDQLVPLR